MRPSEICPRIGFAAIICARMDSTRMPGKATALIAGQPTLVHVLNRTRATCAETVILALPEGHQEDDLELMAKCRAVTTIRGPEDDVLARMVLAAEKAQASVVMRVTADNPLVDPCVVAMTWAAFVGSEADYIVMQGLPAGMAVEIVTTAALRNLHDMISTDFPQSHRARLLEHPTLGFHEEPAPHRFVVRYLGAPGRWRRPYRLTVDEPADLELMARLFAALGPDACLGEVITYLDANPEVAAINSHVRQAASIGVECKGGIKCPH